MQNGYIGGNRKFDCGDIEVDRSFLVHSLIHLLAHRGQVIRMSTGTDKNGRFWGIAGVSCKSRSIIEREPKKYKQKAVLKDKTQRCL